MTRVLVTPRSLTGQPDDPTLEPLRQAGMELVFGPAGRNPTEDELLRLAPGCAGWLAGVEPITERVLTAASGTLTVIARNGTGVDAIDLAAAARLGIAIERAPGANANGVAELALALILCGLRDVPEAHKALRAGQWQRRRGHELKGSTIGVVGCGAVGRRLAEAAVALGARAVGYDVAPPTDWTLPHGFSWATLDTLVDQSDVVSLHCPPSTDGRPVFSADRIARMRKGSGLVNTARAALVDTPAVVAALDSGLLGWYATDVFDREPPPVDGLIGHRRVIATPHIGGFTEESSRAAVGAAVAALMSALATPATTSGLRST